MIVATRTLTLVSKSGERKPVELRIEAPQREPDGRWRCWYEFDWPEDEEPAQRTRSSVVSGLDSLAAIQMALMMLGGDLHFSRYHREGKLFWHEGQVGYGIIVHKSARDLLRGEDVEFVG
jgi:hypothetical protein